MKRLLTAIFILISAWLVAQEDRSKRPNDLVITPELMVGITAEANENFPDRNPQFQALLNFGWEQDRNTQEWAQRLKGPRTGISLGYTNYGNADSLGSSFTLMSFIEFEAFKKEKLKVLVGMGGSYFTEKYDPLTNPNNQGITTDLVWSFRAFLNYHLLSSEKIDWRAGLGYFHHSNGHTRLPNQGLNSFLLSVSADLKSKSTQEISEFENSLSYSRSVYEILSLRAGLGLQVLGKPDPFNDKRGVYTLAGEYGQVLNNTFKWGIGFYARYYQHYYDYIDGNESLVQDGREFASLRDNPIWNASNIGVYGSGEFLLNHVGLEVQIGVNFHKPAYKIDWRINQGWSFVPRVIPEGSNIVLGEFDTKFRVKHLISSRMGLKYYLFGTSKRPKNNLYLGFHINSNGGQADFTDLSLGYVYSFNFRDRN